MERECFFQSLLELADDHLILGHRLSEWCGHAPLLEEDLAMPNLALDLIGISRELYQRACELDDQDRSEDDLAFLRGEREFRNCLLAERPNGDFACTMLRQLYFAVFMEKYWAAAAISNDQGVRGIALKAINAMKYHVRHSAEWVIRLGDGTSESATRMAAAVDELHIFTAELFLSSEAASRCEEAGLLPGRAALRPAWELVIGQIFEQATLSIPGDSLALSGGREGRHDECLGFLLAEMQFLQRSEPGVQW